MRAAERIWPQVDRSPGETVRYIRRKLGLSQREFARALGWSPGTISRWETGRARPTRLGMKIILAFAAERGVWPPPEGRPQLPAVASRLRSEATEVVVPQVLPPRPAPACPAREHDEGRWGARLSVQMEIRTPLRAARNGGPTQARPGQRRWRGGMLAALVAAAGIVAAATYLASGRSTRQASRLGHLPPGLRASSVAAGGGGGRQASGMSGKGAPASSKMGAGK